MLVFANSLALVYFSRSAQGEELVGRFSLPIAYVKQGSTECEQLQQIRIGI